METLTPKQQEVLRYIGDHLRESDDPLTIAEIAAEFTVSGGTMRQFVLALERKGYIVRPGPTVILLTPAGHLAFAKLPPSSRLHPLVQAVQEYLGACDAFASISPDGVNAQERRSRLARDTKQLREKMRAQMLKVQC